MLAYAANRPVAGKRESSPNALLLVISVHVALLALAMSAKMDFPKSISRTPPLINIPVPVPPAPQSHLQTPQPHPRKQWIDHPDQKIPYAKPLPNLPADNSAATSEPLPTGGDTAIVPPLVQPSTTALPHRDARLLTPSSELKPPYPAVKLASEEEATIRLRLTINEKGRVTSIEPVGYADREFLETARRYIIAHWQYEPASEAGVAVSSAIIVTLRFQLDS